jgi:protein SCO1/2
MIDRRAFLGVLASSPAVAARAADSDPLAGRFGGPFDLIASDGRRVTDRDFLGKFLLVYFGYTRCPDVCPVDLLTIGQALVKLGPEADRIQPLFITVDPARDTPTALADFVSSFHPRLLGLGGDEDAIAKVARAYKVHRVKYIPANDPANYGVDHSSLTYLMGPDGAFRTIIPHGASPDRMAEVVRAYLARP